MRLDSMEWPSGVGGVQCDSCERFTICRWIEDDDAFICRPCCEGWSDDEGAVTEDD